MRQIGTGQTIWWRASQSPTPLVASCPPLTATAVKKPRRPLVKPTRRARARFKAALPMMGVALAGAAAFLLIAGTGRSAPPLRPALAEIERMLDRAGYGLTQISLTGHRLTPDSDIFDAIDLASTPTVLSFDTRAAQARVESLSWIERASIERVFPDRLEVHITERMPFAVWQLGARHYLIDKTGRVLTGVAPNTAPSLPRIAGEGAPTAAAALYTLLAGYPALAHQVEVAERIGERRWTLRLAGGGAIDLPADGVAQALARAPQLVAAAAQAGADEIDLRVPGRALVRKASGARQVVGQIPVARLAAGGI